MELFEEIRREYEFGVGTIRGVAKKLKVHRRLVREAMESALPMGRKKAERCSRKLEAAVPLIERMLEQDRTAPRKQRHTAHRIWERLKVELPGFDASERRVRQYVRQQKERLGMLRAETCVPQSYGWGSEAQVDWYEAYAELDGESCRLQVFSMRSMASGGAFHRAYRRATQQAFLEGHERAFAYFGGVFHRIRYDNLGSAVKKIVRGARREETARFIAFRSHWRFASEFCTPAEAHEKGGVEGEVGYFRRNHWVPVPTANSLGELNEQLLAACRREEQRQIAGHVQPVGAAMQVEREHLLPEATAGFELAEISFPKVDGMGRVRVRSNFYSAPLRPGICVEAKVYSTYVQLWHEGREVAEHERSYGRQQQVLNLEHYLDVLERKPGALAGSKPLEQWRKLGRWPESYDRFWGELMTRHGKQNGTKQMIGLLQLGREYGEARLRQAVETALAMGCKDEAAVRYLMQAEQRRLPETESIEVGLLAQYERPLPNVNDYDQLLSGVSV